MRKQANGNFKIEAMISEQLADAIESVRGKGADESPAEKDSVFLREAIVREVFRRRGERQPRVLPEITEVDPVGRPREYYD